MLRRIAVALILLILGCLALWPAHAHAQGSLWESYTTAGVEAHQQGNYPESEEMEARAKAIRAKHEGRNPTK